MKNLILFILILSGFSINSHSQTYYNPSNKVDFTITIKESYKPVDYSKIGRDFNTMIQNEVQRRENLKRYYDEIYYQTKNSVYSGTVLTSDNLVNSKILMVQSEVIERLDVYNRLLKSGLMKPNEYESNVRNINYTYMNTNQVFLQIVQYKYNKDLELGDQIKINEHNKLYSNTLNSIKEFQFNNSGEIEFVLDSLIYPNNTSNSLYEFVRSSSEGEYDTYKNNWENHQRKVLQEEQKKLEQQKEIIKEFEELKSYRRLTFDSRKESLNKLGESERKKFRKEEIEFVYNKLDEIGRLNELKKNVKYLFKEENKNFELVNFMFMDNFGVDPFQFGSFTGTTFYLDCINEFIKSRK